MVLTPNERPEKSMMENGESSHTVCVQPKFKRRKVSAVRDFPPGCGRFVPRTILGPTKDPDLVVANGHESNRTHPGLSEDLQLVVTATLRDEDIPFLADGNFFLPLNGSVDASNGNGFVKRLRNYPPRRKVSAVRDFPPNCGRYVPRLISAESANDCASPVKYVLGSEKSEPEMNGEMAPTHVLDTDDKHKMEDVRDGATLRSEMSGDEVPKNVVQPKESDAGMKRNTPDMTMENGVSKINKEVLQGKRSLASLTKGKEMVRSGVDDKPTSVTMKTVRKKTIGDARPKESPEEVASRKSEGSGKGNYNMVLDKNLVVDTGIVNLKQTVHSSLDGDSHKSKVEGRGRNEDEKTIQSKGKKIVVEDGSGTELDVEEKEKVSEPSFEDKLFWWDHEAAKGDDDFRGSGDELDTEKGIHSEVRSVIEKQSDPCGNRDQAERVDFESSKTASGRVVVQDLKASPSCPWKQEKSALSLKPPDGMVERIEKTPDTISSVYGKKTKMTARKKVDENVVREMSLKKISSEKETSPGKGQLVNVEKDEMVKHRKKEKDLGVAKVSRSSKFYIPPIHLSTSSSNSDRSKVKETLRLYHTHFRRLVQEDENSKSKEKIKRIDMKAATYVKNKGKLVNQEFKILGSVPGVEIGDEFQYRAELNIIGLHRQIQGGIDYMHYRGKIVATSIVASGGYSDDLESSDTLVYTGQGGNVMQAGKEGKDPEDQKLERGNLALKNSVDEQTPVRVIRGSESADAKFKTYVYDGLYLVGKYWQDVGPHGKLVYQFRLTRIPDQPELAWKEVKKRKKNKSRAGICVDDISSGKEVIPICAVNTVNDEKPPNFNYITTMIFPDWYEPSLPKGCGCNGKCSDSSKCACAVKNGGEIPFNHNGLIVEVKALVLECGPNCRCSASCPNRVSQHGIKYQLEIFKTEKMGWGVRSLNFIPSGGFVCEYVGELLSEKEADERTGNDEYLFDIGNNYNDNTFWEDGPDEAGPSQATRDGCFTIDAVKFGNVGRFINHSCTPNLYAQNVMYDHDDSRIPRIMLFAAENIPAMRELTYHYNYTVDQVRDSNGNIKKKSCFCGSPECTGRLY